MQAYYQIAKIGERFKVSELVDQEATPAGYGLYTTITRKKQTVKTLEEALSILGQWMATEPPGGG